jgi:hypothetical protein
VTEVYPRAPQLPQRTFNSLKRKQFLAAYAQCGSVKLAAESANVNRDTHYEWLKDPAYKQAFEDAREEACDRLGAEARRRAMGWEEPVIYQGALCYHLGKNGKPSKKPLTVARYSDILLMFLLKAARPEKYRDNWKGELKHSGTISPRPNVDLSKLTDEQFAQLEQLLEAAGVTGLVNGSAGEGTTELGTTRYGSDLN